MFRRSSDLLFVILIAGLAALALGLGSIPILQTIFGLPLVLILPGYALTAIFFPPRTLGGPERLLLSVASSLSMTILGSLALHWSHIGLRPATWAALLVTITLVASLAAGWRRQRAGAAFPLPSIGLTVVQGLMIALAGAILAGAIALARLPSPADGLEGYTILWVLPSEKDQAPGIRAGITCNEFKAVDYRLVLTLDDEPLSAWETLHLEPGQKWQAQVVLPAGTKGLVRGVLYRLDNPGNIYRQVDLWYR